MLRLERHGQPLRVLAALVLNSTTGLPTDRVDGAFAAIKDALTRPPVLAMPDPDKQFEVRADAFVHGTGAVLFQEGHPTAFTSNKFTPAQRNYATTDQELLVLYTLAKNGVDVSRVPHILFPSLLTTSH
jgi:hypothetical protein